MVLRTTRITHYTFGTLAGATATLWNRWFRIMNISKDVWKKWGGQRGEKSTNHNRIQRLTARNPSRQATVWGIMISEFWIFRLAYAINGPWHRWSYEKQYISHWYFDDVDIMKSEFLIFRMKYAKKEASRGGSYWKAYISPLCILMILKSRYQSS